jgi:hypothetical protein
VEHGGSVYVPSVGWIVYGQLGNSLENAQQLDSLESDWKKGPKLLGDPTAHNEEQCIFQVPYCKMINCWTLFEGSLI